MQNNPFDIDQLTLEYFTNKNTYKKYLAKKDPENSGVRLVKMLKGKESMLTKLFSQMLEDPISNDFLKLYPSFETYIFTALEYLEKHESIIASDPNSIECNVDDSDKDSSDNDPKDTTLLDEYNPLQHKINLKEREDIEYWKSENVHKIL